MKFELSDFKGLFDSHLHGCKYRAIIEDGNLYIELGCYHLSNLQTGFSKILQTMILDEGKFIDNNYRLLINENDKRWLFPVKELRYYIEQIEPCKNCGGRRYKDNE